MQKQIQSQKQGFSVLPQQIQLLKLFHLNTTELNQRIQEELMENIALEEASADNDEPDTHDDQEWDATEYSEDDIPDYKVEHHNYLSDSDLPERPLPEYVDFRKDLKEQMRILLKDPHQVMIAEYLVGSLNDEGMLEEDIVSVSDALSFQRGRIIGPDEVECVRQSLLQLAPGGIGCFTIREFLLFQMTRMQPSPEVVMAIRLLESNFSDLTHHRIENLSSSLGITPDELGDILKLIRDCKLKPLSESSSAPFEDALTIDFVITQSDEGLQVSLYRQRSSTLFINNTLIAMMGTGKGVDKGTFQYLKSKLNSAQWFVSAIKQRETTMLAVMNAIVRMQQEYFRDGDMRLLKPMILKNIADTVGIDISTTSRITCNKYADTHFGTVLLKDLFTKGVENEKGEAISNRAIQKAIEDAIMTEDIENPFTDQQLVGVLAAKGFNIARRTVAKYRDQCQIPVMQIRALRGNTGLFPQDVE